MNYFYRILCVLMLAANLPAWAQEAVPPASAAESASAAEPVQDMNILEYRVEGNTVLPVASIEAAVYPWMGEKRTIKDVEAARTALEKAYQEGGYLTVFVDIPEQRVTNGVVRLRVTEGRVERLRVSGSRYYSLGAIKAKTPDLAEGNVPYFPDVQTQLAAVNTTPDRRVTPVLRPGRTPGKVEVDLKVEDKLPLHGNLNLNDRYSPNTSRTRLNASLRYDNLWQKDHGLTLSFQTAPENMNESKVYSATYVMPIHQGNYLALYGVRSESDVAALGDVNVLGKGDILGLRYILPLRAPDEKYYHSLTLGADYKSFKETVNLLGADSFNTPITYLPFSLGYEATLQGKTGVSQMGASLNFSLRGLGNDEQEFADKRFKAMSNYMFLRLDLKRTQKLPADWSLFGRLSGQIANGPLISTEQFAAGGADTVRGYLESSALGDNGAIAGLELRSPSYATRISPRLEEFIVYGFAEGARLRVIDPLPAQINHYSLLGAGLGLRFMDKRGISGMLEWAYPFEAAGSVEAGDSRAHFRLGYEF